MLAEMSGSLHIGLAAVGSAIGVGIIGMKAAEATGKVASIYADIKAVKKSEKARPSTR